jgi:hypothetical protein
MTRPHRRARLLTAAAADPLRQATDLDIFDQYGEYAYGNASTKMARFLSPNREPQESLGYRRTVGYVETTMNSQHQELCSLSHIFEISC